MGRNQKPLFWNKMKPDKLIFKPKHIDSKDILISKYKARKASSKRKKKEIKAKRSPLLASIKINNNRSFQTNEKFIVGYDGRIAKVNLDTMDISHLEFCRDSKIAMCAIPDQKYFCIDNSKNLTFLIDQNLSISNVKNIKPKAFCSTLYLDGLIYAFDMVKSIETYDLKIDKWRKAVNAIDGFSSEITSSIAFEGKIVTAHCWGKKLMVFDPFSNSLANILETERPLNTALLVAENKLYCIQAGGNVFESLPRDCFQWQCIGKNYMPMQIFGISGYSLYNDWVYFVGYLCGLFLYKFNLKSREITYIDQIL